MQKPLIISSYVVDQNINYGGEILLNQCGEDALD